MSLCVCPSLSLALSFSRARSLSLHNDIRRIGRDMYGLCAHLSLSLSNSVSLARFMYDILMIGRDLY